MIVKNWRLKRLSARLMHVEQLFGGGFCDCAIQYHDGAVAYDFPERIPAYVKKAVRDAFAAGYTE